MKQVNISTKDITSKYYVIHLNNTYGEVMKFTVDATSHEHALQLATKYVSPVDNFETFTEVPKEGYQMGLNGEFFYDEQCAVWSVDESAIALDTDIDIVQDMLDQWNKESEDGLNVIQDDWKM